jgi:Uma2 family endonuclease
MALLERDLQVPEPRADSELPLLANGDHMDQATFHTLYEKTPEGFRAELIGGIVFVASPTGRPHMRWGYFVGGWLFVYEGLTPGVEGLNSGTVILGPEDEPEPDHSLRIPPELGGRTRDFGEFVQGAPELLVEVASSSAAIDLHRKKQRYQDAGADEYLVLVLHTEQARWFSLQNGAYVELPTGADGIIRSQRFPGLWLDPAALFARDRQRIEEVVRLGCSTQEHAEFVQQLVDAAAKNG